MTTAQGRGPLTIAYVGNFGPEHSTENHIAKSFESHGHVVLRFTENDPETWRMLPHLDVHLIVWTRTWSWVLPANVREIVATLFTPLVGLHLDRLWGLDRESLITTDPFFDVDVLFSADGGHPYEWARAGIEHRWMMPAVFAGAINEGRQRPSTFRGEIAFVGSHTSYHHEWRYRLELVKWLKANYRDTLTLWPQPGRGAVRGQDLDDLYATVPIIVGDSCLAGGITHYWSDRIPETLGRGGFLIHPDVDGLRPHFIAGEHLVTYPVGDFDALAEIIRYYRSHRAEREGIAAAGRAHVLANHTYEVRVEQVLDVLEDEGVIEP